MSNKIEIRELIDKLNYYTKLYDEGTPEISDQEWDDLYFKLVEMEKETGEYYEDSPTQRINYEVKNKLDKAEHSHPMLSLDKTKSIDEVKSFIGSKDYIAMAKMDGLTCSLTYNNGRLIKAETRGNGLVGEDITHNALVIKSIPNKINHKGELVIDGEIICTYHNFEQFKDEYKNPRNFASGSIRLLDSKECEKRKLTFVAWDVIKGFEEEKTLHSKIWRLKECHSFEIVPYQWGDSTENEEIEHSINEIKENCQKLGYPIDGIVFKYNNVKEYLAAGRTDHHFKGGLAYKFYDSCEQTELLDIEYGMSRNGILTPVAVFKEIELEGTIVNRASLSNISILKQTLGENPFLGQKIWISKRNQIIPKIEYAEDENGNRI